MKAELIALIENLRSRANAGVQAHGEQWCSGVRFAANMIEDTLDGMDAQAIGFVNVRYGSFFSSAQVAATERNDELLRSGELVRVYTHPPAAQVPEGWKLVPVELTLKMQHAYFDVIDRNIPRVETDAMFGRFESQKQAYRAMLSASPTPPAEKEKGL